MGYVIAIIISIFIGGFLGYKFGDAVSEGVYSDYEKVKAELAKLKAKI